jgi:hypothetical protein
MGNIYENATAVFIWLGEDDNGGSISNLFKTIEKVRRGKWRVSALRYKNAPFRPIEKDPPGAPVQSEDLPFILRHSWFLRAWTLQEVLLARRAVLMSGEAWID